MKTDTNYYIHDSNARNDEKLLRLRMRHKAAGYGVYFMLLEILREREGYMCTKDYNVIAFELREDAGLIKSVVEDFGLFSFTDDGKCFYSESFARRMEKIGHVSKARRDAARKRWGAHDAKSEEAYIEQLKVSEVWLLDMEIKHRCTREALLKRLDEFAVETKTKCYTHKNRQDVQRHFHEWLTALEKSRKRQPKVEKAVEPAGVESLKVYDQWAEAMCMKYHLTHEQLCQQADAFALDMACGEKTLKDINNIRQYFNGWLRSRLQEQNSNGRITTTDPVTRRQMERQQRVQEIASQTAALAAQGRRTTTDVF